ncbi:kinase DC2 [Brachionus plicatilis]|uniref:Kinase DC2 n=1 Tax=Brachionus plicatilis TaxID=10195 RepID=A0A3M7SVC6_BRAPC|nr:kinase DC2 [Brachionus plicatilis]
MSSSNNSKPTEQRINLPYLTLSGVSAPRQPIPVIYEDSSKQQSLSSSASSLGPHSFVNSYVNMNKLHQLHESESAPNLLPLINHQEKSRTKPVPVVIKSDVHNSISALGKPASHYMKKRFNLALPDIDAAESTASSSNSKTNSNDSLFGESGFNFKRSKINMGTEEVKRHRWFISITNWTEVSEKKLVPPFLPEVSHPGDTRNFDHIETPDLSKAPAATDKQLDFFYNF